MDAGSLFDSGLVVTELPTVLTGAVSLILLKALTVLAATRVPRWMEPNRLEAYDAIKLALLLSGGGEFAFVVLALAEKLEVLPKDLGGLLTAIVLITMAVTPLLGQAASTVTKSFAFAPEISKETKELYFEDSEVVEDAVVVCGYGEVGRQLLNKLDEVMTKSEKSSSYSRPHIVAFDTQPSLINNILVPTSNIAVMYGNGQNPEVLRNHGVNFPKAIFISYEQHKQVMAATLRLRSSFENTPIYTRAQSSKEAQELKSAGASEVIVEDSSRIIELMAELI